MAQEGHIKTIRELLGLEPEDFVLPTLEKKSPPAPDLPQEPAPQPEQPDIVIAYQSPFEAQKVRFWNRDIVRYPLIFGISLFFFYMLLNFRAVSSQIGRIFSPPPENEAVVLGKNLPDYQTWIKKYYVYVNNQERLAANQDADRDGLTNLDEFYLGTNPLKRDTDDDGRDDGGEVLDGNNPLYQGKFKEHQSQAVAQHLNLDSIQSRRSFNFQRIAGSISILPIDSFQIDPSRLGRVEIPKLGVDAPIIWSKEFAQMEEDLKHGVAHHPESVFPGERGTASVHGHSSGYPWDGNYKYAFTKINFLEPGDEIFVTVYGTNGESRRYRYLVRSKQVFAKDDPRQFDDLGGFYLNLSTSWPIGTARERYIVTTELVGL